MQNSLNINSYRVDVDFTLNKEQQLPLVLLYSKMFIPIVNVGMTSFVMLKLK